MKKAFLWLAAALLVFAAERQEAKWKHEERSFLAFGECLSVPILCCALSRINKNTSGFGKRVSPLI